MQVPSSAAVGASEPTRFDPAAVSVFRFRGRELDRAAGEVRLRYALGDLLEFEERITLPPITAAPPAAAVEGALDLLHLAAGTSYFKAADPEQVDLGPLRLTPAGAELANLLYREGLAEFRHRNGRPVSRAPRFSATAQPAPTPVAATGPALVPVGGGKDSIVTLEALRAAGQELTLFSIGTAGPIARTVEVAQLSHLVATRRIDPALLALNERGALNGHVPVTAIVSAVAVLVALLTGHGAVVMSNERSAGEGSFFADGVEVNHQFSKGPQAERALRAALREVVGEGPEWFSLLRPASELAIARAFARLPQYHHAFTSCNTVFRLDPARRRTHWCGECDKCRFVFLILAPFLGPDRLVPVFGRDLFAEPAQLPGFLALLGLDAHKPFECVGTVAESVGAARMAAADPEWSTRPVVAALAERIARDVPPGAGDPADALRLADEDCVPAAYRPAVEAALGA